jgi:microcin C transport system permease protein
MSSSIHASASAETADAPADAKPVRPGPPPQPPQSVFQRRLRRFRQLKRGYYSFLILAGLYLLSFFNPLLINNRALVVRHQGKLYFPVVHFYEGKVFGQRVLGEAKYRELKEQFAREKHGDWVLMPPYPFHPNESLLLEPDLQGEPPHSPSRHHWLGTDDRGRDVFARLAYGFRISITFALAVTSLSFVIGIAVGSVFGFFGGKVDIVGQRLVEIWAALPFLYTMIIVSSIIRPNVAMLAILLALFGWVGLTFYVRGEFYREKAKDYVAAAIAQGESDRSVMFRHILPNALTPVVSFAPFSIVADITALVSLDFLGFGLPAPTPSWGELMGQGLGNLSEWHLIMCPLAALFFTLVMVVFIGEAVREAFDPRAFSRLR